MLFYGISLIMKEKSNASALGTRHNCVWDGVRHKVVTLDFLFSTKRFLQSRNHPPSGHEMGMGMDSAFSGIM